MDNYTHIKTLSLEDAGHYLCETMDYVAPLDKSGCDICPMWPICNAKDIQENGWINWLREVKHG
jgi:hypothetical protein